MQKRIALPCILILVASIISCAPATKQKTTPKSTECRVPKRSELIQKQVKLTWMGAVFEITNKQSGINNRVTVAIGQNYTIPGSDIVMRAEAFLPDAVFNGYGDSFSQSNEPNNPASKIVISERDAVIFEGWLNAKYPEYQPFTHDTYSVTLLKGVRVSLLEPEN